MTRPATNSHDWLGRRVTVMGLGRHGGGLGAARYLARRGASVTISDTAAEDQLSTALAALADVPIPAVHLGPHREEDFTSADSIVVNPAVRPDHPLLGVARSHGVRLTSEIELFLEACPARILGVTGTNGKSTTATLLAKILNDAEQRTWLGGNIGGSLLGELDAITADDFVVFELSSFQLQHLSDAARRPDMAVITNCVPHHLDGHGSFESYVAAKRRIVGPDTKAVVNADDGFLTSWLSPGQPRCFAWPLDELPALEIPGEHNRGNAALAAAAAERLGIDRHSIRATLAAFTGLEHRIQFVAEVAGRQFYNDSKATSPDAAIAALNAVDGPLWLIAGGRAQGTSFDRLAGTIVERAKGVALFGTSRDVIEASIRAASDGLPRACFQTPDEAFDWCWRCSLPGDAILLSPACASHDQFADFAERGRHFCQWVERLEATHSGTCCGSGRVV